ncbi:MAG: 1-deoxy-D-xylulose-5-phosphate reductoisomerase [Actinomycetota bacterium]
MAGPALNPVVVLGATGSIGSQTLEVADRHGYPVAALAAGRLSPAFLELAARYPDALAAVATEPETPVGYPVDARIEFGADAVAALAQIPASTVVNGIVGAAGLESSLSALEVGNRLALANKESLLVGGPLILDALDRGDGELIPVDSEHSAIWQCLAGEAADGVRRVILTASGGPFHSRPDIDLAAVTVDQALAHPTWDMGPRITVDSATLMNKAFEVIEAHFLFGLQYDQIDVVIHPTSYVHSLVEFTDGVVKAELGPPDMRKPIQRALTAPGRLPAPSDPLDLVGVNLRFEEPDRERFSALDLGYEAGRRGGNAPAVLNAADEVAVAAFLDHRIRFDEITDIVSDALDAVPHSPVETLSEALAADAAGRNAAAEAVHLRASR